jgi:hypothetical protein
MGVFRRDAASERERAGSLRLKKLFGIALLLPRDNNTFELGL